MAKHKKKKRSFFIDAPLFAMFLSIATTVAFIIILFHISRYSQIHSEYYLKGILVGGGIFVFLQVLFIFGYVFRWRFFRKCSIWYGVILLCAGGLASYYLIKTNNLVDTMIVSASQESSTYVLINVEDTLNTQNLKGKTVGYVSNTTPDFATTMKTHINKIGESLKYQEYRDNESLLRASANKDIDAAVVPNRYNALASSIGLAEDPFANSKVLAQFHVERDVKHSKVSVTEEPFTVLMLGINENLSDSMILASFNPKSMTATLTSIPRDSYVPISCYPGKTYDKITHARGQSRDCSIQTVESFLDTTVNFYFETDFYALVKIVDALGGLEITSPATFAGSYPIENSSPIKYEGITVQEGTHIVDGKQALTFARERHTWESGDFQRQMNQQYVIRQVANKLLSTRDPNKLLAVLDGAKDNIKTNLPLQDISSLMGYAVELSTGSEMGVNSFRIISSQISGEPASTTTGMSVVVPYAKDVEGAQKMLDWNTSKTINLENHKSFNFTLNKPYDNYDLDDSFKSNAKGFWGDGAKLIRQASR